MTAMWGDCPRADIMDAWCEALGPIEPERIRDALANVLTAHPQWPPTLGEFLILCKPVSVHPSHRLLPSPQREAMSADAKLVAGIAARAMGSGAKRDPKRWARDILEREARGERLLPIQVEFAREALGLA